MSEETKPWKSMRTSSGWANFMAKRAPALHKEWLGMFIASTKRGKLSEKMKHLVWVATDVVVTHLYSPGAVLHAQEALAHGATLAEVMDTLRLACIPATRGLHEGYAVLAEAMAAKQGGTASDFAASFSTEFTRSYQAFIDGQLQDGLDARSRLLVRLAVVSNPATAYRDETRTTIHQALELGVDPEELLEVMEISSLITSHAFSITLSGLAASMDNRLAD